jgi:hypothetical protein
MEHYFNHKELSDEEKKIMKKPEDYLIFSLIDDLSHEELTGIDRTISPKEQFLKHYCNIQTEWLNTFKYFWGEQHHTNPDLDSHWVCDFTQSHHPRRYRLWFAVNFPEQIDLKQDSEYLSLAKDFLLEAQQELVGYYKHIISNTQ